MADTTLQTFMNPPRRARRAGRRAVDLITDLHMVIRPIIWMLFLGLATLPMEATMWTVAP